MRDRSAGGDGWAGVVQLVSKLHGHRADPLLLTPLEAAQVLLLVDDDDAQAASRRLNRLVDKRQLRPCMVGGRRMYATHELERFVRDQTARYGELAP